MSTDQAPSSKLKSTQLSKESKNPPNNDDGEGEPYEPWKHREVRHPLGVTGACLHLLKGSLGTGILSMPMAFRDGGLWAGLVGSIAVGILYTHCVHIMIKSSQALCVRLKKPQLTYGEVAELSFESGHEKIQRFSKAFKHILDVSVFVDYYFCCVVYILFTASTIKQVLELHWTDGEDKAVDLDIRWYIMVCTLTMLPLALITSLKSLVPFSFVAIVTLMLGVAYVFFDLFQGLPFITERPAFTNAISYTTLLSTAIFAMDGIGTVLPIENDMEDPSKMLGCPGVLNLSMASLVIANAALGFVGFWRYGDDVKGVVTLNIKASIPGQFVKCVVTINVILSYGLFFYVICGVIWKRIDRMVTKKNYYYFFFGLRVVLTIAAGLISVVIPDIEIVIGIVGAISSAIIVVFFPPVIELATFWEDHAYMGRFRWKLYKNIMIFLFFLLTLTSGVGQSINKIIDMYSREEDDKSETITPNVF